ncbi:MAG TPA: cbb3-type cytochrome c oxidase subunit I [Anaerolineae bacterium]|nr:cbb3-type cytochrome c oxidase subunit I [Anaerolineae bacterium]HMR62903.1 cbb3-type cytochrome c oxidase subunit I [Anaerolineae bacterium]
MIDDLTLLNKNQRAGREGDQPGSGNLLQAWLFALDHKRVAVLYFGSISLFLLLGGLTAAVLRLELMTPPADFMTQPIFKRLYTSHGLIMVFFGLVPALPAVFGNYLVPLMIGAKNVAFPRLNLLSWYLYLLAGMLLLFGLLQGGLETGWTLNIYLSGNYAYPQLLLIGASIILVSFSSILLAVNLIATIHKRRAPELIWSRLPLFVWSIYISSVMVLLGTPVLIVAILLLLTESRHGLFAPELGGDPILYQRLFWFYGNQIAYAVVLPALGILFELITAFSRRQVFGYRLVVAAFMITGYLGLFSWGIRLASSDQDGLLTITSSFFSMLLGIPFSLVIISLVLTLYQGDIRFDSPLWFALGGLGLILVAGLSGLILSTLALVPQLHGTYFVTAHVHYAAMAVLMIALGGLHFWWPKITGRRYPEGLAKAAAIILFLGTNLTFFVQFGLGYLGLPQNVQVYPQEFLVWQAASSLGTTILILGYILPVVYLGGSIFFNQPVTNPWQAKGLVWESR